MAVKTSRWHQTVKRALRDIGTQHRLDVSESEKEFYFPSKFQQFSNERRRLHSVTCKPDVIWKKAYKFRAVFEIEYVNSNDESESLDKKKYCIGSLMQAVTFMYHRSADYAVFITNSRQIHEAMMTFLRLLALRDDENIIILYEPSRTRPTIMRNLSRLLNQTHVLPKAKTNRRAITRNQPTLHQINQLSAPAAVIQPTTPPTAPNQQPAQNPPNQAP
jgi:hypothetical protein